MEAKEAIQRYIEKFGGFPYFLFMGAEDEEIVNAVKTALETEQEIRPDEVDVDY